MGVVTAPAAPEASVTVPPFASRLVSAVVEPLVFVVVAIFVALIEYFVAGPLTDLGP